MTAIPPSNILLVHDEIYPLADITDTIEEVIIFEARQAQEAKNAAAAAAAKQHFQESLQTPKAPSTVTSDCYSDGDGVRLADTSAETSFDLEAAEQPSDLDNINEADFNDFLEELAGDSDDAVKTWAPVGGDKEAAAQVIPHQEEALDLMSELAFNDEDDVPQNLPIAQENREVKGAHVAPNSHHT